MVALFFRFLSAVPPRRPGQVAATSPPLSPKIFDKMYLAMEIERTKERTKEM